MLRNSLLEHFTFVKFLNFFLVSIFYCYQEMRRQDRKGILIRERSSQIDQSIGLPQLWDLRCGLDVEDNGYRYSTIGADEHISAWVDYGIDEGLLSHSHRDDLDRWMNMGRTPVNNWLMERLADAERLQMVNRFQ